MPGSREEAFVQLALQFAAEEGAVLESPTALADYLTEKKVLPLDQIEQFTLKQLRKFCDEYQRMVKIPRDSAGPSSSPIARARPNRDAPDAMSVESDSGYESYITSWLEKTDDYELVIRLFSHPEDPQATFKTCTGKFRREKGSLISSGAAERYGGHRQGNRMRVHFKIVGPSGELPSGTTWCTIQDLDEVQQPDIVLGIDCMHQSQGGENEGDAFGNRPHVQDQPVRRMISQGQKRFISDMIWEMSEKFRDEPEENASKRPRMELPPDD